MLDGYNVMVCAKCGAGYADGVPCQDVFDKYYATMSKYEHGDRGGAVSPMDIQINRKAADLVVPFLRASDAIADIGCATGALLAEFKRRGFEAVIGFDPSPACCATARRLYDIEVRPATICQLGQVAERFDVVMLTGVLEHLCDVEESLGVLIALLKPEGRVFIAMPDASHYPKWFSAPYQFFSMEHVNFFGPQSLSNLMARHGFSTTLIERVPRFLGLNAVEPVIMGLFDRNPAVDTPNAFAFDRETGEGLRAYIKASRNVDERVSAVIGGLAETQVPLLVWGAGTHTLRLLESSPLASANIVGIVDSNRNYHGKSVNGIPIVEPSEWHDHVATILISSHVAEEEIKRVITEELRWPNPVICLYDTAPLSQAQ